uniref:DUF177 domain-containing protein n=1 Tax=Desulfobacca acetoxidans TaxID=60893 RepID=A0A7V6DQL1_9BACT
MHPSTLQINIARLKDGGLDLDLHLEKDWFSRWQGEDPDLEFSAPGTLNVRVHLERHGHDILVRGHLDGMLSLMCSRCLVSFDYPVAADFDLLLAPAPGQAGPADEELTKADLDRDFYSGETVNLESIVREQVLLTLPLKPLCAEACKGLCPRCGADLNQETCQCPAEESTSPLAIVKNIKL